VLFRSALVWVAVDPSGDTGDAMALVDRGVGGVVLEPARSGAELDPQSLANFIAQLKQRAARPLIVAVSQEGGRQSPLGPPFAQLPPMGRVGLAGDLQLAPTIGDLLGKELRAVGIDVNLAPVLDVDTREDNPLVGDRSFGISPPICSAFACGVLEAMQGRGVAAIGRHFPGLGDLANDPRKAHCRIEHGWDRLDAVELPPFFNAIQRGIAGLLVGHARFDAIDPDRPASQSATLIDESLRNRLGFEGLVLSEDVTQPAAGEDAGTAAAQAVVAGCDAVLLGGITPDRGDKLDAVIAAIEEAIASGHLPPARLQNARRRRDTLAATYVRGPAPTGEADLSCIGSDEHRAATDRIRIASESR
jgi:beta-N-acetylhexosaminidase